MKYFQMARNAHITGWHAFFFSKWYTYPLHCTCRPFSDRCTDSVCVVFLHMTEGHVGVSVYCRHVTVIAEAIKCRYTDGCSGSFIKWWSERESWKDEADRRGCKSAEEGSAQVDETFLGRLPTGSAGPRCPFRHFPGFFTDKLVHAFVLY